MKLVALTTGVALLIMAIAAIFGVQNLHQFEQTIATNSPEFRLLFISLGGWAVIILTDLMVAWGVIKIFGKQHPNTAVISAIFRIIYVLFLIMALYPLSQQAFYFLYEAPPFYWLTNIAYFHHMWSMGYLFFGMHLLTLGYLIYQSSFVPNILSFLIAIAGLGYLVVNSGGLVYAEFTQYKATIEMFFIPFMMLGELSLAIWLIYKHQHLSSLSSL